MRYLGSKENLLNFIDEALRRHSAVSTAERLCPCATPSPAQHHPSRATSSVRTGKW